MPAPELVKACDETGNDAHGKLLMNENKMAYQVKSLIVRVEKDLVNVSSVTIATTQCSDVVLRRKYLTSGMGIVVRSSLLFTDILS